MAKMIFVNLPVDDVARATKFYEALGFVQDPRFSNEQASSMQWSDTIVFMLLDKAFYQTFTSKRIADTHATSAALLCLSRDSRAEVDSMTEAAIAAGGREHNESQDHGFMYGRSFEDPDGHILEVMHMDMAAAEAMFAGEHQPA